MSAIEIRITSTDYSKQNFCWFEVYGSTTNWGATDEDWVANAEWSDIAFATRVIHAQLVAGTTYYHKVRAVYDNGTTFTALGALITTVAPNDAIPGAVVYKGTWDASTNTPTIPAAASGNNGWYYRVSVAGSTSEGGITDWKVGDWLISDGTAWQKVDNTDQVTSVAGRQGAVTLAAADISGLSAVATSGSASDLGSGTLPAARLPLPASGALGGVKSLAATAHKFLTAIDAATGAPTAAQPVPSDIDACYFLARGNGANNVTGDSTYYTVVFDVEDADNKNAYNPASGVFTAPVTGLYHFEFAILMSNIGAGGGYSGGNFLLETTSQSFQRSYYGSPSIQQGLGYLHFGGGCYVQMTAGDTAKVRIAIGGGAKTIHNYADTAFNNFAGRLVG